MKVKKPSSINSVFKTFRLIEILSVPNAEYSLTEVTKKLDLSIGATQRITNSLISIGYLSKDKKTKKFRLTPKWLSVGFGILAGLEIRKIALPHLKQLYRETGGTVSFVIRDGDEVVYIERLTTQELLGFNIRAGLKRPMYLNSMGRAILAFLPEEEQDEILKRTVNGNDNANGSLDEVKLKEELRKIRQSGYAVNRVNYSGGATAVSVPIFNQKGKPIAGINIGMPPKSAEDDEYFQKRVDLLMKTGGAISSEIGYMDYMEE
ncbi:MAG: IclR family transcriptional regulator [Deltaproteobacteria bacterium]|nr:IclR family transcriptional regulator [Deltaproteobacteria bacterium]